MDINIFLYDDFDALGVFGPAAVFNQRSDLFHINYISMHGDIVNSCQGAKLWTQASEEVILRDVLILPNGPGARRLISHNDTISEFLKKAVSTVDYCLLVGNGIGIIAQTGLLFHRHVADFEMAENWKRMFTAGIHWIPGVTWAADGKFYSSTNSISAINMALGIVAELTDSDMAEEIAKRIGYSWNIDENAYY